MKTKKEIKEMRQHCRDEMVGINISKEQSKNGEPCSSCHFNERQPSEQPCASCHQSYDGDRWHNYYSNDEAFKDHMDTIEGIDKIEKMYNL
jgi:hypothetical protein